MTVVMKGVVRIVEILAKRPAARILVTLASVHILLRWETALVARIVGTSAMVLFVHNAGHHTLSRRRAFE